MRMPQTELARQLLPMHEALRRSESRGVRVSARGIRENKAANAKFLKKYGFLEPVSKPQGLVIYIDLDDTVFDYSAAHAAALKRNPAQPFPQSQFGFFMGLEPIDGALRAYEHFVRKGHRVIFLTAPSVRNPMSYLEKRISIEQWFGFKACYDLMIAHDKSLVMGDVLIDNCIDTNNQDKFKGHLIHFGCPKFQSWGQVQREVDALHKSFKKKAKK